MRTVGSGLEKRNNERRGERTVRTLLGGQVQRRNRDKAVRVWVNNERS
jgi:hypothetical protein